jgi:hypothetical protein
MKRIIFLFAFLCSYLGYSQVVSAPLLYSIGDAQTSSASPGTPNGTIGTMDVSKTASSVFRSFVKFRLDTIPANAVITSAILMLTPSGTEGITTSNSSQLYLDVCNSSWTETGITHSSNISNNTLFPTITLSSIGSVSGKREFEMKDFVQAIIDGRLPNEGFRIRRSDETTNATTTYYTRENGTQSNRPQLFIQYYIRSSVSAVTIVHTSSLSSTDGSISPTIINGSNTVMNFRWYNSNGTQIATTQNLTGIGKGWYGLKYYGSGSTIGDTTYQAFIVGTECEDVSITFDPGPNYIDDARPSSLVQGSGTSAINYTQVNYGSVNMMVAERWTNSGTWYGFRSLIKFRLWVDPNCQVNTANMTLTGNAHYPLSVPNNSELLRNTSNWTELGVANTNLPTTTTTGKINIANIPTGNSNATIDIADFFNTWKTNNTSNYGLLFQLQSPAYTTNSYTRMQFHSSDATTASNRPQIIFSIKVNTCDLSRKGTVTVTANDPALKKNVQVSITPPSWAVSPYRYVISELPIPDPRVVLKYLNDSIFNPDIDSTTFYQGLTASASNDFGDVDYSNYNIAVFDNVGKRIFNTNLDVFPNITLLSSTNISLAGYELTGTNATSRCEVSAFVNSSVPDCSVKFRIGNTSGDQYYGFLDASKTLTSSGDISYGFHIKNGVLKTIVNAKEIAIPFSIYASKEITVSFLNDSIIFSNDSIIFNKAKLISGYSFKVGAVMNASSKTLVKLRKIIMKPFYFFQTNVSNNSRTCSSTNSDLSFRLMSFLGTQFGNYTYKLSSYNGNGLVLAINTSASNSNTYTIPNVAPGVYTLTCTQNSGTPPIQLVFTVYVGIQTEWFSTHPNYNLSPNTYSVTRDNLVQGTYSKAMSTNVLPSATSGWAWFNPICANTSNLLMGNILSMANNSNLLPNPNDVYLNFKKTGTTPILGIPPGSTILFWGDKLPSGALVTGAVFVQSNPFVSMQFDAGLMKIYVRSGATTVTLNQPTGNLRLKANSALSLEGFSNVHSTFPCGINQTLSQVGYYELSRDYTAGYATAVEGKLKFTFDEEYEIQSTKKLQYAVFNDANDAGIPIASGDLIGGVTGGATALTYSFDDNRYILTISSFCTIGKFYHLEVTTTTGQKRVVRFLYKN